jgi:hypothetical protein
VPVHSPVARFFGQEERAERPGLALVSHPFGNAVRDAISFSSGVKNPKVIAAPRRTRRDDRRRGLCGAPVGSRRSRGASS